MALNVGINGFGRIGRIIFRSCHKNPNLKVSAINDPAVDIDYICYLIKFDSTHGKFSGLIEQCDDGVVVDGQKITVFREKLPTNIPWHTADVQYVVEASGMFTNLEKASGHLSSDGVKRVIVTAPSLDVPMVILGVNDDQLSSGHKVISCASSTLYCLAPIINVLEENFGVSEGFITSIHAMTPSLKPLDGLCLKGKHWRDHRSIHQNIIPASTGACRALGKIIPQVKDKMTGLAFRVPIVNVSVLDITIRLKTNTTMEEIVRHINNADKMTKNGVIKVSNEQAVSSDFVGDTHSCILDLNSSLQLTPDFFKLICWYENEYSYACRIIDSIFFLENQYQMEWNTKIAYARPAPNSSFVQQSVTHNKIGYHHACSNNIKDKSLSSTSQDSGFKSLKRSTFAKKPLYCRNFEVKQQPLASRFPKNKNELFKIWNDDENTVRTPLKHNRSSFFQSCVAITPQTKENTYVKTQERLESVKKEFSKMVSMTENLLKKSCHSKENGFSEVSPNNEAGDTKVKFGIRDESKISLDNKYFVSIKENEVGKVINQNMVSNIKTNTHNNEEEVKSKRELNINSNTTASNLSSELLESNEKFTTSCLNPNNENPTLNNDKNKLNNDLRISQKKTLFNHLQKIAQTEENVISSSINDDIRSNVLSKTALQAKNASCNNNNTYKEKIYVENESIGFELNEKAVVNSSTHNHNTSFNTISDPYPHQPALLEKNYDKDIPQIQGVKSVTNLHKSESIESLHVSRNLNLQKRLEGILKKLVVDANLISEKSSMCVSSDNAATIRSNRDIKQKQDIFDKLDSVSATDSENSFHINERKSQIINITDLTNSLEDLERLDRICRIIEISDDLSDQLLSALNSNGTKDLRNKHWSFKNLCEKLKLDDFCNKIFSK